MDESGVNQCFVREFGRAFRGEKVEDVKRVLADLLPKVKNLENAILSWLEKTELLISTTILRYIFLVPPVLQNNNKSYTMGEDSGCN